MTTMIDLACFPEPYKLAFHEIYRLLNIAIVLSVASAACERSFSAMKLIKTSTMSDIRLSSLALLSIECVRAESINMDTFVDEFDSRHDNGKLALH